MNPYRELAEVTTNSSLTDLIKKAKLESGAINLKDGKYTWYKDTWYKGANPKSIVIELDILAYEGHISIIYFDRKIFIDLNWYSDNERLKLRNYLSKSYKKYKSEGIKEKRTIAKELLGMF